MGNSITTKNQSSMAVAVLALLSILLIGCGGPADAPPPAEVYPDTFRFMGIGVNTPMTAKEIDHLSSRLGPAAVDKRSTILLEMKYKGFLRQYYPGLSALNDQLNVNDVVRKEYPATRLMFRQTKRVGSVFDQVELIYENRTGRPLLVKLVAKSEIPALIAEITGKYGDPERIDLAEENSWSLKWSRDADVLVITRFAGVYNRPEHHMMIVYRKRIDQMLSAEQETEEKRRADKQTTAKDAF